MVTCILANFPSMCDMASRDNIPIEASCLIQCLTAVLDVMTEALADFSLSLLALFKLAECKNFYGYEVNCNGFIQAKDFKLCILLCLAFFICVVDLNAVSLI